MTKNSTSDQAAGLRRAQADLKASRTRYFDLYDLAPVGYFTLTEKGLILEANLTAADLLGVAVGALVKQPITRFILKEDKDIYYQHRKLLFEAGVPQVCELRLVQKDGAQFWARLESIAARDADGAAVCRTVMSNITERKRAESQINERIAELQRWHNATLGRESRILDLKREVNELLGKAGQPPRYPSAESRDKKEL